MFQLSALYVQVCIVVFKIMNWVFKIWISFFKSLIFQKIFVCIHPFYWNCLRERDRGTNSRGAWGVARVAAASGTLVDCLPLSFVESEKTRWPQSVKDYDKSKYNYV